MWPDARAVVGHFDDEALAVDVAADTDLSALLAIVGVHNRVGDDLGYGRGDGLGHLLRSARRGCELDGQVPHG